MDEDSVKSNKLSYFVFILDIYIFPLAFPVCDSSEKVFHEEQVAPSPSTKAKKCTDRRWGEPVLGEVKELPPLRENLFHGRRCCCKVMSDEISIITRI